MAVRWFDGFDFFPPLCDQCLPKVTAVYGGGLAVRMTEGCFHCGFQYLTLTGSPVSYEQPGQLLPFPFVFGPQCAVAQGVPGWGLGAHLLAVVCCRQGSLILRWWQLTPYHPCSLARATLFRIDFSR